jgi:hypothetical protein
MEWMNADRKCGSRRMGSLPNRNPSIENAMLGLDGLPRTVNPSYV